MIAVTFDCGHTSELSGNEVQPLCKQCGATTVVRVNASAPIFRGCARGPCSQYQDLPAKAVSFEVSNV